MRSLVGRIDASRSICVLLLALLTGFGAPANSLASDPPAVGKPAADAGNATMDQVVAKRKELAEQIAALSKSGSDQPEKVDPNDVSGSEDEQEFLSTLDGVYAQQQVRLEQRQELQAEQKEVADNLESFQRFGPAESKPYSFLLLESLRDDLAAEEEHDASFDADLKAAAQLLDVAQARWDQSEKERRRLQEELSEADPQRAAALGTALTLSKRESQIAHELILVRRLEVEVRSLRRDVSTARVTLLKEKIDRISKDVHFSKQDLQDRLQALAAYDADLGAQLKEAHRRFQQTESQQASTLQDLHAHGAPQLTIDLATESWRVARDAQQMEITLLNERSSDNKRFHHYWNCRYETEQGTATPEEIAEWHDSLSDLVEELSDNRRSLEQQIETTRISQAMVVQRMRDSDNAAVKEWGEFQCAQWQQLRDACETHLVQIKYNERWSNRFLEELADRLQPPQADSLLSVARQHWETVWNYEFFEVNDKPITVAKVAWLLLYIALGTLAARILSRVLQRGVLPRLGMNEGASHAVGAIAFYSLTILFGVWSFQVVHIPLAAFAFLGGAVAIAIGFGSQDIANNFMSGIIILAEQPIRVGDVVVVDSVRGTVTHIGARSTRLRTDANHEIIVPNSKLLSDKVTNLTLSNTLIQTAMPVSLPPKLTVSDAKRLLLKAVGAHRSVLRSPPPVALLKQCGATSNDFELHFWLELNADMRAEIVQSDVREKIYDLVQQSDAQNATQADQAAAASSKRAA